MDISEELMWRGITPPPTGSNRTTCPYCSKHRIKKNNRCMQVLERDWGYYIRCHHCGFEEEIT